MVNGVLLVKTTVRYSHEPKLNANIPKRLICTDMTGILLFADYHFIIFLCVV